MWVDGTNLSYVRCLKELNRTVFSVSTLLCPVPVELTFTIGSDYFETKRHQTDRGKVTTKVGSSLR